ncbi:PREDICTED: uncharacterized protein LOC109172028 isoform X3 [Ipomoea nil]|uniref:uncharacterized protein LOC109172028 isoform X3 n=1 Tax=Ipomoea nil TaxID=35883 RepID=UPI000901087C|nr:PREDICTED: uncharacterized protein LOC109172028 isoform X3 [Ipomoea nil]
MAESFVRVDESSLLETTPLLPPLPQKPGNQEKKGNGEEIDGRDHVATDLDKALQRLEWFLGALGFNQSSVLRIVVSWGLFLVLGLAVPVVILELSDCRGCQKGQIKSFEVDIVVSQACLAAVSLLCASHNLRKYGIRKFLFVDRYSGHVERFSEEYIKKISDSIRLLVLWVLPCLVLKTAREIIRVLYVHQESLWHSTAILLAFIMSWTFAAAIFLSVCVLFHLVCNLQIIHFDDYANLLERESDVLLLMKEHMRLRYNLSKISHRFRIFLLLEFTIVTGSQFVTLFQTTAYHGIITCVNGGDFAVSSIVQVVGVILCLNAASKISHRAQGIGSLASRWHALATCGSGEATNAHITSSFYRIGSESDLESVDFMMMPTNTHLASSMSSYQKRQSLVMYLQSNRGGITIYGWTVDRGLINTIFFIELSLILFVLGKTIVFTGPGWFVSRN